jgi:hypothetical protein
MSEPERCPAQAASCACALVDGHDGPHECVDQNRCCGAWRGTYGADNFEVIRWPLWGDVR